MTGDAVPPEFIPEGYHQLTNYTEENLDALAEDIAAGGDATAAEVLENLEALVHEHNVPVTEAERSVRVKYGEKEINTIEDPDLPEKYGWDR